MNREAAELDAVLAPRGRDHCFARFPLAGGENEYSDEELAGVLLRNTEPTRNRLNIVFDGRGGDRGPWESLVQAIQAHPALQTIALWDQYGSVAGRPAGPLTSAAGVERFLRAIRQNHVVRTVELNGVLLTGETISSFLDNATFLEKLEIGMVEWEQPTEDLPLLSGALQRNNTLSSLVLQRARLENEMVQILVGLASNRHLQELELCLYHQGPLFLSSLNNLLHHGSISSLRLNNQRQERYVYYEGNFPPIVHSLIHSSSITELFIGHCCFYDKPSANALQSLLTSKPNLAKISIVECEFRFAGSNNWLLANDDFVIHPSLRSLEIILGEFEERVSNACFDVASACGREEQSRISSLGQPRNIGTSQTRDAEHPKNDQNPRNWS